MPVPLRRTLLLACIAALLLPAGAAASTVRVPPPGSGPEGAYSTAATDPGCLARNVVAFKGEGPFKARHAGRIRCKNVRVAIRCSATLFESGEPISAVRSKGRKRCAFGTPFAESESYPAGTPFRQDWRHRLRLRNKRQKWANTTRKCPRRTNKRRTLICRGSHSTLAPQGSVDSIRS